MESRNAQIVASAMVFETGLGFLGLVISWIGGIHLADLLVPSLAAVWRGLAACVPMVVLLVVFYGSNWRPLADLRREIEKIVGELFAGCRWFELALVSIAAGIGEEVLFRGALQPLVIKWTMPWIGIAVVALLFGLAHAVTTTYFVAATLIGVYFGWLSHAFDDLLAPVIAHAAYDFFALVFIQFKARKDKVLPPAA